MLLFFTHIFQCVVYWS